MPDMRSERATGPYAAEAVQKPASGRARAIDDRSGD